MLVINDLELVDSPEYFETRLKAGGVLDVAEKYPWTGEQVPCESPRKICSQLLLDVVPHECGSLCPWSVPLHFNLIHQLRRSSI